MKTIEEIDADIKRLEAERQEVCNIVKSKNRFEQLYSLTYSKRHK